MTDDEILRWAATEIGWSRVNKRALTGWEGFGRAVDTAASLAFHGATLDLHGDEWSVWITIEEQLLTPDGRIALYATPYEGRNADVGVAAWMAMRERWESLND